MDDDLARITATVGIRAAQELANLCPLLAEHLPEHKALRIGIAAAIDEIYTATVRPAFAAHPALEIEFSARIARYGRAT